MAEQNERAADQWERVEVELRACRAAQQRTWGDIDPLTLGRYLSDEVDGTERRRVEQALDELPELRRLTDLVRDVLGEAEPAPALVETLPFRARRVRAPWRRYAALAAAASVLLVLGVALPRLASPSAEPSLDQVARIQGDGSASRRPDLELALLVQEADDLQERGRYQESLAKVERAEQLLVRAPLHEERTVEVCERLGEAAQKAGDLDCSERLLQLSYAARRQAHPASRNEDTKRTTVCLANAYQYALNSAPTPYRIHDTTTAPLAPAPAPVRSGMKPLMAVTSAAGAAAAQVQWKEQQVRRSAEALRERIARQNPAELQRVVVPALIDAVQAPSTTTAERVRYISALARLGPAARQAIPVLVKRYHQAAPAERKDGAENIVAEQRAVILALGQLGGVDAEIAAPVFKEALESQWPEVRVAAETAQRYLQPAAERK
jgi:hypothetical protein